MCRREMRKTIKAGHTVRSTPTEQWGYAWIDRALLRYGGTFTGKPQKLTEVWKDIIGVGMVAIVRLFDMKIIYLRGM